MINIVLSLGFFIALGSALRFIRPNGMTPESMQRSIVALVLWVLLPLVIFFSVTGKERETPSPFW